jgi:hypothetical protein
MTPKIRVSLSTMAIGTIPGGTTEPEGRIFKSFPLSLLLLLKIEFIFILLKEKNAMVNRSIRLLPVTFIFFWPFLLFSQPIQRYNNKEVITTLSGAMLFIEDNQIRYVKKPNNKPKDSWSRTKNFYYYNKESTDKNNFFHSNKSGIWESEIHFNPERFKIGEKTLLIVPDYNLFVPLFVAYPFYFFDEDSISYLSEIKYNVNKIITSFKKGGSYNFWTEIPGYISLIPRSGPPNIPIKKVDGIVNAYLNSKFLNSLSTATGLKGLTPKEWLIAIKSKDNPTGSDAVFNIPNDADDTSIAVALQRLYCQLNNPLLSDGLKNFTIDTGALITISQFRDLDRYAEDGRDNWKGENTGAYLTWLKSEYLPHFYDCRMGVIPLGINNVDCVVNANVIFSLGINGLTSCPGYEESINLMYKVIKEKRWPEAGLYYPQYMIFPYCLSRAYRDGNVNHPVMKESMKLLLIDLLKIQDEYLQKNKGKFDGAFPGGKDHKNHLSTALGLCTLLNIGEDIAIECGKKEEYSRAIERAIKYLIDQRKPYRIRYRNTFGNSSGKYLKIFAPIGYQWESGLFFSSSIVGLAGWRSKALTAAIVMEALSKYILEYDKHSYSILSCPKINIISYPDDAISGPLVFEIR